MGIIIIMIRTEKCFSIMVIPFVISKKGQVVEKVFRKVILGKYKKRSIDFEGAHCIQGSGRQHCRRT